MSTGLREGVASLRSILLATGGATSPDVAGDIVAVMDAAGIERAAL